MNVRALCITIGVGCLGFGPASAAAADTQDGAGVANAILVGSSRIALSIIFAAVIIKLLDLWFYSRQQDMILDDEINSVRRTLDDVKRKLDASNSKVSDAS